MNRKTVSTMLSWSAGATLLLVLCTWAGTAVHATTGAEAISLCKNEMAGTLSATNIRNMEAREHEDRHYAYGTADFPDINAVHFRCRVRDANVIKVQYLIRDPEFVNGRAWSEDRPEPAKHEVLDLDEAAKSSPPSVPTSPKFERVPD